MGKLNVYIELSPYIKSFIDYAVLFLTVIGGVAARNIIDDKVELSMKKMIFSAGILSFVLFKGEVFINTLPVMVGLGMKYTDSIISMIAALWGFGSQEILKSWERDKVWRIWNFISILADKFKKKPPK